MPCMLGRVYMNGKFARVMAVCRAFATPWEVCFDVAHPPLADVLRYLCFSFCLKEGQRMRNASPLFFL